MFRLLQCVVAMLLVARLLYPPEASVLGETLWITQSWILAVLLWGWDAFRRRDFRVRFGWADAAVWIVVAGHGLATWKVLGGRGDQRAALNLFWEWVGLGAAFFLLRQTMRSRLECQRLIAVFVAVAVMLAGFGIWQHYVELPGLTASYDRITQTLQETTSTSKASRLERELADMGVPVNPASRAMWESRLKSTEPFATFALANTLAGFLAAWLFVAADSDWLTMPRWKMLGKVACLLLMGYCLVLTKSRTAWAGLIVGLLIWGAIRGVKGRGISRRWLLAGLTLVIGFFAIAGFSGGFDWEVVSEAPKSLAYRVQYWAGSWEVVKRQPWLGTGPGNFRQHYLHFKLPESSEEIADPHNWVLDLWTSGGLLALIGFLILIAIAVRGGWRMRGAISEDQTPARSSSRLSAWEVGAGLAFPLVMIVHWLSGEPFEFRLFWLWAGGSAAWGILRQKSILPLPVAGILAGGAAMLVHLLGAGGMEMPAITQTLLLFVVILCGANWEAMQGASPRINSNSKWMLGICGLAVLAFYGCLMTATLPVWYRWLYILSGDAAISREYNTAAAAKWYELAEKADPYSPEPALRLGELHFQRWLNDSRERDFQQAVHYGQLAIDRDPVSNLGYRRLGRWHYLRAESLHTSADSRLAVEYLLEAVARYPNSAVLRAELAMAFHQAKEPQNAAAEAQTALALDEINREAGHVDKTLPSDLKQSLEHISR